MDGGAGSVEFGRDGLAGLQGLGGLVAAELLVELGPLVQQPLDGFGRVGSPRAGRAYQGPVLPRRASAIECRAGEGEYGHPLAVARVALGSDRPVRRLDLAIRRTEPRGDKVVHTYRDSSGPAAAFAAEGSDFFATVVAGGHDVSLVV